MYFDLRVIQRGIITLMIILFISLLAYEYSRPAKPVVRLPPMYVTSPAVIGCDPVLDTPQRIRIPSYENAWQTVEVCNHYDSDEVAWVMTLFYDEWVITFGDDDEHVLNALKNLEMVWSTQSKTAHNVYGLNGEFYEIADVHGLFDILSEDIWLYASLDMPISSTALIHELVHAAIFATTGDADADHEGGKYAGWSGEHTVLIDRLNEHIQEQYDL